MRCPLCDTSLREVEKFGIMIDVCPDCKGIWLDRGELEKLMGQERNDAPSYAERREESPRRTERRSGSEPDDYEDWDDEAHRTSRGSRRRKRFELSDLFDVFGD